MTINQNLLHSPSLLCIVVVGIVISTVPLLQCYSLHPNGTVISTPSPHVTPFTLIANSSCLFPIATHQTSLGLNMLLAS